MILYPKQYAEQYFRIKEENARRTNMSRDDYIGLTQFSQPFSNSTWDVDGEGRSRGSRRSDSRAAQSISNSNVYHPTRTASRYLQTQERCSK